MTAAGAAAFASAHREVDRVLGDTADVRTETFVTFFTGFTEFGIHQIEVADLTDHSTAVDMQHTDFARGQFDLGVEFLFTAESGDLSGRADEFGTGSGLHFNTADLDTDGDIFELQPVARFEFSFGAIHDHIADFQTDRGKDVSVILGFNKADEIFYKDEFEALGCRVYVATADGSVGTKGFVTDVMKDLEYTHFYTCGPEPMLKAVYKASNTSGQLSFEERMGCGFGACMGCTCKTKYGNKRICKDGPVLVKEEIIWEK